MTASQDLTWHAKAAKTLLDARRHNGRVGSKKSRSGCITCRIRRVKCDERKPECKRCVSTGRKCDGYSDSVVSVKSSSPTIGRQLSNLLGLAENERRPFDFFLSWTAPRLAGSLDKEFWCGHVLQVAQSEPVIRDSLLALSILYEHPKYMISFHDKQADAEIHSDESGPRGDQMQPRNFDADHLEALRLYNRAIAAFKQKVTAGDSTPLLAVLSCLLFICIEFIRDNVFAGLSLFSRGVELMRQLEPLFKTEKEQGLLTLIRLMFGRLNVLAATYGHTDSIDVTPEAVISGQRTVFSSVSEARTALWNIMADSHAFIQDANEWKALLVMRSMDHGDTANGSPSEYMRINSFDTIAHLKGQIGLRKVQDALSETGRAVLPGTINLRTGDELPSMRTHRGMQDDTLYTPDSTYASLLTEDTPTLPPAAPAFAELQQRESVLQKRLGQWLDAFQWPRTQVEVTEPELVSHLMLYYHVVSVWCTTRLITSQMVFDDYTFHFRELVRHAEVYVKAKTIEQLAFTFEIGAVPPMYFTATKCRIPSLRRRALDLLSEAPRKECMWGATGTAELICRLITIEEEGLGLPLPDCSGRCAGYVNDDTVLPAEEMRVHNLEILRNRTTQSFDVRVTRYSQIDGRLLQRVDDFPI